MRMLALLMILCIAVHHVYSQCDAGVVTDTTNRLSTSIKERRNIAYIPDNALQNDKAIKVILHASTELRRKVANHRIECSDTAELLQIEQQAEYLAQEVDSASNLLHLLDAVAMLEQWYHLHTLHEVHNRRIGCHDTLLCNTKDSIVKLRNDLSDRLTISRFEKDSINTHNTIGMIIDSLKSRRTEIESMRNSVLSMTNNLALPASRCLIDSTKSLSYYDSTLMTNFNLHDDSRTESIHDSTPLGRYLGTVEYVFEMLASKVDTLQHRRVGIGLMYGRMLQGQENVTMIDGVIHDADSWSIRGGLFSISNMRVLPVAGLEYTVPGAFHHATNTTIGVMFGYGGSSGYTVLFSGSFWKIRATIGSHWEDTTQRFFVGLGVTL